MNDYYRRLAERRRREVIVEAWLFFVAILGFVSVLVGEAMGWL